MMQAHDIQNLKSGDILIIDIMKSGYWVGWKSGRFLNSTPKRVKVRMTVGGEIKYFNPENITLKRFDT